MEIQIAQTADLAQIKTEVVKFQGRQISLPESIIKNLPEIVKKEILYTKKIKIHGQQNKYIFIPQ